MTTPKKTLGLPQGVYDKKQICELFQCSESQINDLIEAGVIPAPIKENLPEGASTRGRKRRWLAAEVDRRLGRDRNTRTSDELVDTLTNALSLAVRRVQEEG